LILHLSRKLWGRAGRPLIVIFGWALIASYASLVHAGNNAFTPDFTTDFETGNHSGWDRHGNAFQNQPTRGDNPSAGQRPEQPNHQGEWWIGTFERYQGGPSEIACTVQGNEPTGSLQSGEFTIPAGSLAFLVGGGAAFETRVELIVLNEGGDVEFRENRVFYASGRNKETMRTVTWNLDRYEGARGFIRIVDNSSGPWGHINADHFRFIPGPPIIEVSIGVPDLEGRNLHKAREIVKESGLQIKDVQTIEPGYVEGLVIRQSPAPGTPVAWGTGISLVLGPPAKVRMPGVIGMSDAEATRVLLSARLSQGDLLERESREERAGIVIEQDPPAGSKVDVGRIFNLVVAVKPATVLVSVPDLIGLTPQEAKPLLREFRLLLGEVATTQAPGEENRIVRQDPTSDRQVEAGTSVGVVVSVRQRLRVEVPNLLGRQQTEVAPILEESQLLPGGVRHRVSEEETGVVLDQQPLPGERVEANTVVNIVVASKPLPWVGETKFFHDRCFINDRWLINDRCFINHNCPIDFTWFIKLLWLWILIIIVITLILAAAAAYLDRPAEIEPSFTPHPDPGKAGIAPGHRLGPDFELRLRPVKDAGVQRVDAPNDLVQNETDEP
jgi:beta-lactam-binding protein with PASTA domain